MTSLHEDKNQSTIIMKLRLHDLPREEMKQKPSISFILTIHKPWPCDLLAEKER